MAATSPDLIQKSNKEKIEQAWKKVLKNKTSKSRANYMEHQWAKQFLPRGALHASAVYAVVILTCYDPLWSYNSRVPLAYRTETKHDTILSPIVASVHNTSCTISFTALCSHYRRCGDNYENFRHYHYQPWCRFISEQNIQVRSALCGFLYDSWASCAHMQLPAFQCSEN